MLCDFSNIPRPLLHLITLFLTASTVSATPYPPNLKGLTWDTLFGRSTCANPCGWEDQLCCGTNEACYTNAANQAQCSTTTAWAAATTTTAYASDGYWSMYTTVYVETDLVTVTSVVSEYVSATTTTYAAATATTAACDYSLNETPCGSICCASNQYCYTSGQCAAAAGGSSGYSSLYTTTSGYSAALRPTSSTVVVVTATNSPTTTVPFESPVETGTNVTLTQTSASKSSKLSGGAIAGIVIGSLLAVFILFWICVFYLCRGLWHGLLAILGLGNRKRRTETTEYIEERHHSSYGGGSGRRQGRTWYGASRPNRVERRDDRRSGSNWLGIGAGLAALAVALGFQRSRKRRQQEEKTEYTGSSYGSYYTSESSASSDDRRTRDSRRSRR